MRGARGYEAIGSEERDETGGAHFGLEAEDAVAPRRDGSDSQSSSDAIPIRVLDVTGNTYELHIPPSATVLALKAQLAAAAAVETERQRIIFMGRVLSDAEVLSACRVERGSVLHLFQRPKTAHVATTATRVDGHAGSAAAGDAAAAAGHTTAAQSHPALPNLVIGLGGAALPSYEYGEAAWALEQARRGLRLLAFCLFLFSAMQFRAALGERAERCFPAASLSRAPAGLLSALMNAANDADDDGSGGGGAAARAADCRAAAQVPWVLAGSAAGILVSALGIRASDGAGARTVRLYQIGLALTAVVAMFGRANIVAMAVSGALQRCLCAPGGEGGGGAATTSSSTSTATSGISTTSFFGTPAAAAGGAARSSCENFDGTRGTGDMVVMALSQMFLLAAVWGWCVVRAHQYGNEIIRASVLNEDQAAALNAGAAAAAAAAVGSGGAGSGSSGSSAQVPQSAQPPVANAV
ncbi:hypothetical protein JKP88DRAFT_320412 [Tribonema minus]|uniref:Ubiquitin-like domain-containing protein n=1 Tax=Tribonema minus TaxID=303371 RepID=A0A836CFJ8_9STRA|nr:hypothetical protein JKP88DRAFT_320412 [Tribonema minus]